MIARGMLSVLTVAVLVYGGLCTALLLGQGRMVWFPSRDVLLTPAALGLAEGREWREQWIDTEDGLRLHAWWVPGPEGAPVVLFLHGNAGNISHRLHTLELLHGLGLGVLLIDYRGYGLSEGTPDEAGTYRDAEAAFRHLRTTLNVAPGRIVLHGRSLGGAVAAWLAARRDCRALVVESGFTSVPDLAADLYPVFPVRLLARIRYDTRAALAGARCPVLVVHSRDDEIIPYRHGERLHAAAREPKRLLTIRGGHNDGFLVSGETYRRGLADFLAGPGEPRAGPASDSS